ncbi:MAG TPA: adenine deaminase [Syntrophales bacterium]|nr:adenine deaminase [Syntrophales bacterium]
MDDQSAQPESGLDFETYAARAVEQRDIFAGRKPCDLLIRKGRVVNVFTGEILDHPVAIHRGRILAFEDLPALESFDADGLFVTPGFADCHIHIESSMLSPPEFARAVVCRGTTAVFADPHEISNALGEDGFRYMLDITEGLPLDVYFLMPSCVPATPFETTRGDFPAEVVSRLASNRRVLGLAEFMNFPGVLTADRSCLEKLWHFQGGIVDGHGPLLSGRDLSHYIASGIGSDHETTRIGEGREKLRKGMFLYLREGTSARNLQDLAPLATPSSASRLGFASDDRSPEEISRQGHMDFILRRAVRCGIDPVTALRMACLNPFGHFRIYDRGALAPGYRADLALLEDLSEFTVKGVLKDGRWVWREGRYVDSFRRGGSRPASSSMRIPTGIALREAFDLRARGAILNVIGIVPGQILTDRRERRLPQTNGVLNAAAMGLAKVAVIERHRGTGNVGVAFVEGLGIEQGAIASTIAHDSHNIIVAGADDDDMLRAVEVLRESGGGLAVIRKGKTLGFLPLPIGGLMSDRPFEEVASLHESIHGAASALGRTVIANPFMHLSFLALPVIPHLKVTDRGLFDVDRFEFIPLTRM